MGTPMMISAADPSSRAWNSRPHDDEVVVLLPPRLHLRRGSFVSKWNWKAACLVCIQLMPLAFLANNSIACVCVWFLLIGRRKSRSMVSPCQDSPLKLHYSFSFHFYAHRLGQHFRAILVVRLVVICLYGPIWCGQNFARTLIGWPVASY